MGVHASRGGVNGLAETRWFFEDFETLGLSGSGPMGLALRFSPCG